jgi:hypothetical protein
MSDIPAITPCGILNQTITPMLEEIQEEVIEIEHHLHNYEKWFGLAGTPSGETHRADRMGPAIDPFTLTAGNLTWGAWVQVLGSNDTPVQAGKTKYDFHRAIITDTTSTNPFIIQIISGESSEIAAKLLAEDFDEFPYVSATNNNDSGISDIIDKRIDSGCKCWMRCCAIGANAPTLKLYIGIHEYEV